MKKNYNFLLALLFVSGSFTMSYGQVLFTENFNTYTSGTLNGQGGWSKATTSNTISSDASATVQTSTVSSGNSVKLCWETGVKTFFDKALGQTILSDADTDGGAGSSGPTATLAGSASEATVGGTVYWIGFWYDGTAFAAAGAAQIVLLETANMNVDLSTSSAAEGARNMRIAFGKTPTFNSSMTGFTRSSGSCGAGNWPGSATADAATGPAKASAAKYYVLVKIVKGGAWTNFGTTATPNIAKGDAIRMWHYTAKPTAEPTDNGDYNIISFRTLRDQGSGGTGSVNGANASTSLGCRVTGGGVKAIRFRVEGAAAGSCVEFDDIEITKNAFITLPIELMDFSAVKKNQSNFLTWTTASEKNNKGFYIERSNDATNWNTIGFEKGAGESNQKLTYNFTDNSPLSISYYRLRQVDVDGKEAVSKVVSVAQKGQLNVILTPNPAKDVLNMTLENEAKNATALVYDMVGRQVLASTFNGNQLALNVANLTNGMYMIHIQSEGKTSIQKFVKN